MKKRYFAIACSAVMFLSVFSGDLPYINAASVNGALSVPYSFKNIDGDDKPKAFEKTNLINIALGTGRSKKKISMSELKASATIYVPVKTVSKNGSSFGVMFSAVTDPKKYGDKENASSLDGAYIAAISKQNGKLKKGLYDAMDGAELEGAANHITIKRGKGSHKNDYIMTINNIPYNYLDGQPVSNSRHYLRAVVLSVYGQDQKAAGNICIDKVSVKRAKKTVLNYTFDSKKGMPKDVSAICNNKSVKGIDIVGL